MGKGKRRDFEDISSYSSKKAYKRNRKKKRHTGVKIFLGTVFSLCILLGAFLIYVSVFLLGGLKTTPITATPEELGITADTHTEAGIRNIMLFGIDTRGGDGDFSGNSDVMMVITVDHTHGKIKLASIMRDARVYMGDISPYGTGYDKLNGAFAYGGPETAIRVINQNYGLDIQDYVIVNFAATAKIVNAMGGAEVELTEDEIVEVNKNLASLEQSSPDSLDGPAVPYSGPAGTVTLDGNQAVAYGRIRYIGNDNERVERQQEVISSLLGKVTDIPVLEYPGIISKLAPICETSLSFDEMIGMSTIALTGFTVERLSIPSDVEGYNYGTFEGGMWMWDYDLSVAADHLHRFIYEDGE